MGSSLKEALKKAYAEKGHELPDSPKGNSRGQGGEQRSVPVTYGKSHGRSHVETGRSRPPYSASKAGRHNSSPSPQSNSSVEMKARIPANPNSPNSSSARSRTDTPKVHPQPVKRKPPPDYELGIVNGGKPTCLIKDERDVHVYIAPDKSGIRTQAHAGTWDDEREVAIGLDFGTSSVKVIIGDSALEKAFAVPFNDGADIRRYLLPSRLYETASDFSLGKERLVYRDLKLSLLADPDDEEAQVRVTALLALVIRHARGWLLSEHRDVYRQTNILWKLAVGLPAAHHLRDEHQSLFQKVSQAAWLAASSNKQELSRDTISVALARAEQLIAGATITRQAEETEVSVVPEIAAQIYGYVASNRFDKKAKNLFLMVDVGAGTVDSSLFQVKAGRGGKFGFTFYTSQVQPNGVMNLHRHRMQWWEDALVKIGDKFKPDTSQLHESKFSTDRMRSIPESYTGYFSDISVQYRDCIENPDQNFFMKRVVSQVRGKTMWRTWKDGLLPQQNLNGVPMFLCGGGTRMQFYRNLEQEMQCMPGYNWLKAEAKPIEVPRSLVAPGLSMQEYDRLSVAFGLSFLDVSEVIKGTPDPTIAPDEVLNWRDNYIDKDQC